MWYAWETGQVRTGIWWAKLRKIDNLQDLWEDNIKIDL